MEHKACLTMTEQRFLNMWLPLHGNALAATQLQRMLAGKWLTQIGDRGEVTGHDVSPFLLLPPRGAMAPVGLTSMYSDH